MPIILLIIGLNSAHQKGTLERVLKQYARYELLIIAVIGHLPIECMMPVYYSITQCWI